MKKLKVAIIGHFGGNKNMLDGQTVKTRILYEELSSYTDWSIKKLDTYYKKTNPVKLLAQTIFAIISIKDIIVLLSGNGMKFFFPILSFAGRFFGTRVYHDVIGGNFEQDPKFSEYLNTFQANWVETNRLKKRIESYGIKNCEVIPNFKRLNILSESEIRKEENKPFRFCTFSRVMKEKGIEDAIAAVEEINSEVGETVCILDIYGQVDIGYKERFADVMSKVKSCVQYQGTVPFDKSVEAIKDYDALLFPTYWDGEGFPGTIIDAYSAGLPVIATDWNCNSEVIEDKYNGILYPNEKQRNLKESMQWAMSNSDVWIRMRKNCVRTAKLYQPDVYVRYITERISRQEKQKVRKQI